MSDPTTVTVPTNDRPNSCVNVQCDCNTMWSMAQQFSTLRLCTKTGDFKAKLVKDFAVRARRIAATYARFYLELEDGGNPQYKGRYYWAALGAFASKTVACTLETWQIKTQALLSDKTREGLGKGNFWLFCDISGWHWLHCKHPDTFEMCMDSRDATNLVPAVKAQVAQLPWSSAALGKIDQMRVSAHIKKGFEKVAQFERASDEKRKLLIQMEHLMALAHHEQGVVLQPLIYDDADFAWWIQAQRLALINWATPKLELVFTSACSTRYDALKSSAPKDIKLESFLSRIRWIKLAAENFHNLMQKNRSEMENQLRTIASWVANPDTR